MNQSINYQSSIQNKPADLSKSNTIEYNKLADQFSKNQISAYDFNKAANMLSIDVPSRYSSLGISNKYKDLVWDLSNKRITQEQANVQIASLVNTALRKANNWESWMKTYGQYVNPDIVKYQNEYQKNWDLAHPKAFDFISKSVWDESTKKYVPERELAQKWLNTHPTPDNYMKQLEANNTYFVDWKKVKKEEPALYLNRTNGDIGITLDTTRWSKKQWDEFGKIGNKVPFTLFGQTVIATPAQFGKAFSAAVMGGFANPEMYSDIITGGVGKATQAPSAWEYKAHQHVTAGDLKGYIGEDVIQSTPVTNIILPMAGGAVIGKVMGAIPAASTRLATYGAGRAGLAGAAARFGAKALPYVPLTLAAPYVAVTGYEMGQLAALESMRAKVESYAPGTKLKWQGKTYTREEILAQLPKPGATLTRGLTHAAQFGGMMFGASAYGRAPLTRKGLQWARLPKTLSVIVKDEFGFRRLSLAELKAEYKRLSLKYHPDKPGGSTPKFMAMEKAYKIELAARVKHPFTSSLAQQHIKFQQWRAGFGVEPKGGAIKIYKGPSVKIKPPRVIQTPIKYTKPSTKTRYIIEYDKLNTNLQKVRFDINEILKIDNRYQRLAQAKKITAKEMRIKLQPIHKKWDTLKAQEISLVNKMKALDKKIVTVSKISRAPAVMTPENAIAWRRELWEPKYTGKVTEFAKYVKPRVSIRQPEIPKYLRYYEKPPATMTSAQAMSLRLRYMKSPRWIGKPRTVEASKYLELKPKPKTLIKKTDKKSVMTPAQAIYYRLELAKGIKAPSREEYLRKIRDEELAKRDAETIKKRKELIKSIQNTYTPEKIEAALKTRQLSKDFLVEMPKLGTYKGKVIVTKEGLKRATAWKQQDEINNKLIKKWRDEQFKDLSGLTEEQTNLAKSALQAEEAKLRAELTTRPITVKVELSKFDAYRKLRIKERQDVARKMADDIRRTERFKPTREIVYPEIEEAKFVVGTVKVYGRLYKATSKQTLVELQKLKAFQEKQAALRLEQEKARYGGLTHEQDQARKKILVDIFKKENAVREKLNKLEKTGKIAITTATRYEVWGNVPVKTTWQPMKPFKYHTLEVRKPIKAGPLEPAYVGPRKPLKPEIKTKEVIVGKQIAVTTEKLVVETSKDLRRATELANKIDERELKLEKLEDKLWSEKQIKSKVKKLEKYADAVNKQLTTKLNTYAEQQRLRILLRGILERINTMKSMEALTVDLAEDIRLSKVDINAITASLRKTKVKGKTTSEVRTELNKVFEYADLTEHKQNVIEKIIPVILANQKQSEATISALESKQFLSQIKLPSVATIQYQPQVFVPTIIPVRTTIPIQEKVSAFATASIAPSELATIPAPILPPEKKDYEREFVLRRKRKRPLYYKEREFQIQTFANPFKRQFHPPKTIR